MRLAKTSIIVFASGQFSTVVGFIATFYIASYLGPEVLGAYSVTVGLLYWIYLPASSVNSAITKRMSEGTNPGEILSAGVVIYSTILCFLIAGVVLFSSSIESYIGHPVSNEVMVLIVAWFGASFMSAVLAGQKKVASQSVAWTAGRVVRTGCQIALTFFLGLGVAGLIWGHSLSFLFSVIIGVILNSVKPVWPTKQNFVSLYEYAKYSWLGTVSVRAFNWLDTVILGFFVSSSLIGIYEVAWTMASALSIVSTSIGSAIFPTLSELSTEDRYEKVSEILTESLVFAGIIIIPGLAGAMTVGSRVLAIYGSEYGQGGIVLVLLVVARLTNAYAGLFKNTINAIDRPDVGFRINAVLLASNVVLNISLIPIFGWVGAAIGTAASATIVLLFGYYWVNQVLSIQIPYREIGLQVLASLVMITVVLWLSQLVGSGRVGTVIILATAGIVYSTALLALSTQVRQKTVSILADSVPL